MAFRNAQMIGHDSSSSYYDNFLKIQKTKLSWPNPGIQLIMKVVSMLSGDYQWVIVITAMWVCFAFYKLLLKYSENSLISVMWFMGMLFYTFMFSAIKQAWAMAFLCFAFDAIMRKKPTRFLLFIGLAVIFHFPALVFLPAYWIAKLKLNRAFPVLMFSVLVFVYIFRTQIVNWMASLYRNEEEVYTSSAQFFGTKCVLMLVILGYAFYRYFKVSKGNELFSALLYFMGLAAVIQTFCFYNNTFERLADYYYQFSILFMPLILKRETSGAEADEITDSSISASKRVTLDKKRISNYSFNDIDINTVLAIVITVFCVWRYITTMVNDPLFSPFYFFWQ